MWTDKDKELLEQRKKLINDRKSPKVSNPEKEISAVQGHLAVLKVYPDGREELVQEGKNTITNLGKQAFSRLLGAVYLGGLVADDWRPSVLTVGDAGGPGGGLTPQGAAIAVNIVQPITSGTGIALSSFNWRSTVGRMTSTSEISIVNVNELQIETTLGIAEGAGNWLTSLEGGDTIAGTIREAGLYYADGATFADTADHLIAYKTLGDIGYSGSEVQFSLLFRWTISFANP